MKATIALPIFRRRFVGATRLFFVGAIEAQHALVDGRIDATGTVSRAPKG